jgi:hypothetical protein
MDERWPLPCPVERVEHLLVVEDQAPSVAPRDISIFPKATARACAFILVTLLIIPLSLPAARLHHGWPVTF